jgi:hypothetical protein
MFAKKTRIKTIRASSEGPSGEMILKPMAEIGAFIAHVRLLTPQVLRLIRQILKAQDGFNLLFASVPDA